MRNNQLHKAKFQTFITFIFLTVFSASAFAQNTAGLSEKDLPDSNPTKAAGSKQEPLKNKFSDTISSLTSGTKSGSDLAGVLMGNKASSLMFTDEENINIDRAADALRNNQAYTPEEEAVDPNSEEGIKQAEALKLDTKEDDNEKSYIYLASIIYFTPNDWSVWINQQKITPQTNKKDQEIYLKSVQRDEVVVHWAIGLTKWKVLANYIPESPLPAVNADNKVEIHFTLKPNQTFILGTNSVVEGRAVVALLKKKAEEQKASANNGKASSPKNPITKTTVISSPSLLIKN